MTDGALIAKKLALVEQLPVLREVVGFGNLVVHAYDRLDTALLSEILRGRLGDLQAFVDAGRHRLQAEDRGP